jgi:hypothetical protein
VKYQINDGGWPLGGTLIPGGTILDYSAGQWNDWTKLAQGLPPPANATPPDLDAWNAMVKAYPASLLTFYGVHFP